MQKRRWFQIHLSTAMALMLVASALLWAQFQPKAIVRPMSPYSSAELGATSYTVNYGWPAFYSEHYVSVIEDVIGHGSAINLSETTSDRIWDYELRRSISKKSVRDTGEKQWLLQGIAVNAVVTLVILGIVAFFCEWFIRRREAARERETV